MVSTHYIPEWSLLDGRFANRHIRRGNGGEVEQDGVRSLSQRLRPRTTWLGKEDCEIHYRRERRERISLCDQCWGERREGITFRNHHRREWRQRIPLCNIDLMVEIDDCADRRYYQRGKS
jgi:hypothetical protein